MHSRSSKSGNDFPHSENVEIPYTTPKSEVSMRPKSSTYTSVKGSPHITPISATSKPTSTPGSKYGVQGLLSGQLLPIAPLSPRDYGSDSGSILDPQNLTTGEVADAFRAQVYAACAATSPHASMVGQFPIPTSEEPLDVAPVYFVPQFSDITNMMNFNPEPVAQAIDGSQITEDYAQGDISDSFRQQVFAACTQAALDSLHGNSKTGSPRSPLLPPLKEEVSVKNSPSKSPAASKTPVAVALPILATEQPVQSAAKADSPVVSPKPETSPKTNRKSEGLNLSFKALFSPRGATSPKVPLPAQPEASPKASPKASLSPKVVSPKDAPLSAKAGSPPKEVSPKAPLSVKAASTPKGASPEVPASAKNATGSKGTSPKAPLTGKVTSSPKGSSPRSPGSAKAASKQSSPKVRSPKAAAAAAEMMSELVHLDAIVASLDETAVKLDNVSEPDFHGQEELVGMIDDDSETAEVVAQTVLDEVIVAAVARTPVESPRRTEAAKPDSPASPIRSLIAAWLGTPVMESPKPVDKTAEVLSPVAGAETGGLKAPNNTAVTSITASAPAEVAASDTTLPPLAPVSEPAEETENAAPARVVPDSPKFAKSKGCFCCR